MMIELAKTKEEVATNITLSLTELYMKDNRTKRIIDKYFIKHKEEYDNNIAKCIKKNLISILTDLDKENVIDLS